MHSGFFTSLNLAYLRYLTNVSILRHGLTTAIQIGSNNFNFSKQSVDNLGDIAHP